MPSAIGYVALNFNRSRPLNPNSALFLSLQSNAMYIQYNESYQILAMTIAGKLSPLNNSSHCRIQSVKTDKVSLLLFISVSIARSDIEPRWCEIRIAFHFRAQFFFLFYIMVLWANPPVLELLFGLSMLLHIFIYSNSDFFCSHLMFVSVETMIMY